jgi:hypothetical protein
LFARKVAGTYEKPETTSANGTAATVGLAAVTLFTPGGARASAAKAIPRVTNAKLGNLINDLYKGANMPNPIGTGSTADAIRNELVTGLKTAGRFHSQTGAEYVTALESWLRKNPNAVHRDRMVAESLKDDLAAALVGK